MPRTNPKYTSMISQSIVVRPIRQPLFSVAVSRFTTLTRGISTRAPKRDRLHHDSLSKPREQTRDVPPEMCGALRRVRACRKLPHTVQFSWDQRTQNESAIPRFEGRIRRTSRANSSRHSIALPKNRLSFLARKSRHSSASSPISAAPSTALLSAPELPRFISDCSDSAFMPTMK